MKVNVTDLEEKAMAAAGELKDLHEGVTCSICLGYFMDPVTIPECGHNFCQACLAWSWDQKRDVSCPQCRGTTQRKGLIPNRQLKNMVEITKKLSLQGQEKGRKVERVCEKHQEPLKLFCRDHEVSICVVCDKAKEHESHKVIPQEEAFQEYKDKICNMLKILRAEREKILMYRADTEKESQDLLNQTEEEKQKTMADFRQIHQFLDEQEKILLAQMEGIEKNIARRRDEHLAKLCWELSLLEKLIKEMEEKSQQQASELLQDVRKTLQRSEKKKAFENPVTFPLELTYRIKGLYDVKSLLERVKKQLPVNVTLDPDRAHPQLILSEDLKSVRRERGDDALSTNLDVIRFIFFEKFINLACVLGREGFTSGRHFWEVTVGGEGTWVVGVASKSYWIDERIHVFHLLSSMRFPKRMWTVGKWRDQYRVLNHPDDSFPNLSHELKRIQVTLNCAEGQVSFSDADTGVHLYTYSGASFQGETLVPFFGVGSDTYLSLSL